jgi:hypothetical protein
MTWQEYPGHIHILSEEPNRRYILLNETLLQTLLCEDCEAVYTIVLRRYVDTAQRNPDGSDSIKETSVRTSCYCVEERDPFRNPQPRPVDLTNPRNYPKGGIQ